MRLMNIPGLRYRPGLSAILLTIFLIALWVTGGASRGDVWGQAVIRIVSWTILIILALFGELPRGMKGLPVLWLLVGASALALLQLIPLPPGVWRALPGREIVSAVDAAGMHSGLWRPLTMSPGATLNALFSLVVPFVALLLFSGLTERERNWLPGAILSLITASTFVGLLQFSGVGLNNPFLNDVPGEVSGTFANRNHFALFLAFGCMLAPSWAFLGGRKPRWRGPLSLGLILLFVLTILATGSRAGLLFGLLSVGIGMVLVQKDIRRAVRRYPRWTFPALMLGMVGLMIGLVSLSVLEDRAVSIRRVFLLETSEDMRTRGLPAVLGMLREYFPVGSGFGGFSSIFRVHEPEALLKPTYFNHAHNDLLEVIVDGGLLAGLLLIAGGAWWARVSIRAWRSDRGGQTTLSRVGSAMLLMVVIASAFDYPARTPMMMAIIIFAAMWLNEAAKGGRRPALPTTDQHL